jgi:hypothetical protein
MQKIVSATHNQFIIDPNRSAEDLMFDILFPVLTDRNGVVIDDVVALHFQSATCSANYNLRGTWTLFLT